MAMKHYKITDTWYQKVDGPDVLDINFRDKYPSIMGGTDRDPLGERLGNEITKEMMSGDYEHLLEVFDENFGMFVTLYR